MKIYQVGERIDFYSISKIKEFKNKLGYGLFNYQWYSSKYMITLRITR